jgi:spore germination cell wall hydrolase CwlJ-like protein
MALILDAGALIAIERRDRPTIARLVRAHEEAEPVLTSAAVVAQVIRNRVRQVTLERVLAGVDEQPLDSDLARRAGQLLATSRTSDVVDAALALLAGPGDEVMTSDSTDLRNLLPKRSVKITAV